LLHEDTGGTPLYYHFDFRGDTVALTNSSGAVIATTAYGAYGEILSQTGTASTPFLYNGLWGVQTDSNALYFHRARYYHPELRRWLNADPIGLAGGLNLYGYVGNNPIGFVDPLGLFLGTPLSAGEWFGSALGGAGKGLFYAGEGLVTAPYRLGQGVVSGYEQIGGFIGDSIIDPGQLGRDLGNMQAHPLDTLESEIQVAREMAALAAQNVECKARSSEGRGELWGDLAFAVFAGGAADAPDFNIKIDVHGPHHTFGDFGQLSHVQANWWTAGEKGSGGAFRIPLPWR
jgi:RHS repeat-associated protein